MIDYSRVEHRRRTKTRRRVLLVLAGIVALAAGVGAGLWRDRAQPGPPVPDPTTSPTTIVVAQRVRLLVVSSTFGGQQVLSATPLVVATPLTGADPSRIFVADPALRVVGPAGNVPLREHAAGFGADGLAAALRNTLGLRIDEVASTTEADLVSFFEGFGAIAVTLDQPISEGDEVVYAPGTHTMSATELVTFLAFPFDDPSLDATDRMSLVTAAWHGIGNAPQLRALAERSSLPAPVRALIPALASNPQVEPLAAADTDRGPVLDEVGYRAQTELVQGAWLDGLDPSSRPRVELRGRSFVRVMLLLIADGIRIDRVGTSRLERTTIETDDADFGRRVVDLLGGGTLKPLVEPLLGGLAARVTLGTGA